MFNERPFIDFSNDTASDIVSLHTGMWKHKKTQENTRERHI